jgi:hypothetical protein
LDVISYIGGLFPAIIALFFFMKYFGEYLFQVSFAHYLFKTQETESRNFLQYLKKGAYSVLMSFGLEPQSWATTKRQIEINDLVNRLLDVTYLYKRIEFL